MLLSRRGCVKVASRGCGQRLPLCFCPGEVASRLRPEAALLLLSRPGHGFCLRTGFCLGTGALLPKVPVRPLANDRFLWRLRSGFDGVWLFRIHCPEAAVLPLSKLGCAMVCVYVLELFFLSFKVPKPELGFSWRLAVSDPLPRSSRFAFVPARLRHVFCLRPGALFFSFKGSKGATSAAREGPFFAVPELGFSWRLAVSDPLPRGSRFAFVPALLRHVFCLRTGALFFSFRGFKGATSAACE